MKKITTYEKGAALEVKLAELFRTKGYHVLHNVKRVGRSGTEHQIDVFAEYVCPLHTSKVIVEAKSYKKSIDKDRIMKLVQIVDDLGADRGIIITTSRFTPGAITTAKGHNVELWDRRRLGELLGEVEIAAVEKGLPKEIALTELVVRPHLAYEDASKIIKDKIEKMARGGFLGKGKVIENLNAISLVYHPYYEAEVEATVSETRKTGFRGKEIIEKIVSSKIDVDASTGELVAVEEHGISYPYPYIGLMEEDEMKVVRNAAVLLKDKKTKIFSSALVMGLGFTEGKTRRILSSLAGKGVVARGRGFVKLLVSFPYDPRMLKPISVSYTIGESKRGIAKTTEPSKEASSIIKLLESCWDGASVKKIDVIYYPYFAYVLTAEDGSKRVEALDGNTGILNEEYSKRVKWDVEELMRLGKS